MYHPDPDLVLINAKLITLDRQNYVVEAMAVKDGRIVALGSCADIESLKGAATKVLDAGGKTIIPGFVDSHCHPDGAAGRIAWISVQPSKVGDRASLMRALSAQAAAKAPGEWVAAYRFNEKKSGGYPSIAELDAAIPDRPLFILRTDGHLGLVNSKALEKLSITPQTPDPAFGAFDRDPKTGALTGLVRETAMQLFLDDVQAGITPESLIIGLEQVFDEFVSFGITSAYNSLTSSAAIQAYQMMKDKALLKLRVGIIAAGREDGLVEALVAAGLRSGFGDDMVRLIGVEWCPDCSTSGRTAAYYEPYQGERPLGEPEDNCGILLYEKDDLTRRALAAHRAGLLVCIEGVGDRGIDFALDVIEDCLKSDPRDDHRMRVEHCCFVTPPILARIKDLGVVDSSATGFMYELGDAYRANRGQEAMAYMWPHRALIDAGIPAPGHSDAYICTPNPFTAIHALVNRETDSGGSLDAPNFPSQAVTVEEALRAYTILGAFSGREEKIKGSLEVGKLADFVVLDRDPLAIEKTTLAKVQVLETYLGGQQVFQRR